MKEIEARLEYVPTEKQALFHMNPAKYRLYGGSVGGGKSVCLCMEAFQLCMDFPGNKGIIARKTFQDLRKTTMETFFRFVPRETIRSHNKSEAKVIFHNGSEIQFTDLEDPNKIKSMDLGFWAIDEVTDTEYSDFQMLKSRLRLSSLKPLPNWKKTIQDGKTFYVPRYCGIMASNPEPGYIKDIFIDRIEPMSGSPLRGADKYAFIAAKPYDNPYNPEDYISDLKESDPEWVKKYVEGNWTTFKGQIYKSFDKNIHVKEFDVDWHWNLYRSIDYGVEDPTVCSFIGVDSKGVVYIFDEYYSIEDKITTQEHVENILYKYPRTEYTFIGTVGDTHALGKQLAIDSRRYGLPVMLVQNHKILDGIERVKKQLMTLGGKPMLFVHPRCKNTIREFEHYGWKPRRNNEDLNALETPEDKNNHLMDAIKNAFMTFNLGVNRPLSKEAKEYKKNLEVENTVSDLTGY